MIMYKRVVSAYVEEELRKGVTIEEIKKRLVYIGYKEEDVSDVLRTFEFREADLNNKESKVETQRTKVHLMLAIILLFTILNTTFFFYYWSAPDYLLIKETPTGLVTEGVTEEEIRSSESSFNASNRSVEGLKGIS